MLWPFPLPAQIQCVRPLLIAGLVFQVFLWCFLFRAIRTIILWRFIALLTLLFLISAALIIPGAIAFQRPTLNDDHVVVYKASTTVMFGGFILQLIFWLLVCLKLKQIYLAHKSGGRPQERPQNDNSGNDGYPNGNSSGYRLGSPIARGIDKMILGCWSGLRKAGSLGKINRGPSATSEYDLDNQIVKHV